MTAPLSYYSQNEPSGQGSELDFPQAVMLLYRNALDLAGRSSRPAFLFAYVFIVLVNLLLPILDSALGLSRPLSLHGGFWLVSFIPVCALHVRRLHDVGKSGMWLAFGMTGLGYLIVLWFCIRAGQPGSNAFGRDEEAGTLY
jgi:uncharacterized membrane protein YhaH (DUF805 family)